MIFPWANQQKTHPKQRSDRAESSGVVCTCHSDPSGVSGAAATPTSPASPAASLVDKFSQCDLCTSAGWWLVGGWSPTLCILGNVFIQERGSLKINNLYGGIIETSWGVLEKFTFFSGCNIESEEFPSTKEGNPKGPSTCCSPYFGKMPIISRKSRRILISKIPWSPILVG